ncbi:23S rRNA pseudouridine [Porphyridium purpureum]|uniref:23S rRNA pseudouridine n=1 Tax=Porphyridium purpureum TaxID=35688 RepID=A0A5J4YRA3_PORPP|nr:23S rRNA pseudouridine [Porphyridium purpureum]|eukprot:POR4857..scf296_7
MALLLFAASGPWPWTRNLPQRQEDSVCSRPHRSVVRCAVVKRPNAVHVDKDDDGVRINKCFASFASRRESDRIVSAGRARINGKVAVNGARVRSGDVVTLDGKKIDWERLVPASDWKGAARRDEQEVDQVGVSDQFVYLKYWKPRGITCTTDRRIQGNIIDAIGHRERIFPVGRLDKDSSGLILLTSDGRLPNSMLRAKHKNEKTYRVTVDRPCSVNHVQHLRDGVVITTIAQRDRTVKPLTAKTLPAQVVQMAPDVLLITIVEGRNRQIRKMLDALGYTVRALHRVEIMGIGLNGLRHGQWRELNAQELEIVNNCLLLS